METVIFTLALCGLVIASLQFSYKNSQRISELENKQDKARKDINALYTKPLTKTRKKPTTKKPTSKNQHQKNLHQKNHLIKEKNLLKNKY